MKNQADSINTSIASYDLTALKFKINLETLESVPVVYSSFIFKAKNIVSNNGEFEKFKIDSVNTNKNNILISNLQIIPRYTKKELSKILKKERDYIKLEIPQIALEKLDFNYTKKRLGIIAKSIEITEPNLEIYRDKLVADDLTVKSLYSKALRNLGVNLDINLIKIKNAYISYAELVEADKSAGKLFFKNVNASIYNISNLKDAKKTEIKVNSKFMGVAPLELNWSFDVNNKSDALYVTGSIIDLPASVLNPFFQT